VHAVRALAVLAALAAAIGVTAGPPARALADGPARGRPAGDDRPAGRASKAKAKAASAPPLDGATIDFRYDGKDVGHPERAHFGRVFVPARAAADPKAPRPLLVYLHGMNRELVKHRFMGGSGPGEDDVRRVVAGLVERGAIPPVVLAAPSSVLPEAIATAETSWPVFDLDRFVAQVLRALGPAAAIDLERVVVAGHSGAACNPAGGLFTAMAAATRPLGVLFVDTCLLGDLPARMVRAAPTTHVVATYQTISWDDRAFAETRRAFARELAARPAPKGVFRELEELRPAEPMPHNAMVHLTLERWLPRILPPDAGAPK
jgi:hypothetical protein